MVIVYFRVANSLCHTSLPCMLSLSMRGHYIHTLHTIDTAKQHHVTVYPQPTNWAVTVVYDNTVNHGYAGTIPNNLAQERSWTVGSCNFCDHVFYFVKWDAKWWTDWPLERIYCSIWHSRSFFFSWWSFCKGQDCFKGVAAISWGQQISLEEWVVTLSFLPLGGHWHNTKLEHMASPVCIHTTLYAGWEQVTTAHDRPDSNDITEYNG